MLLDPARGDTRRPLLVCDLTQSWSRTGGGGISTYLREKRAWVMRETPHHLLQIVPGAEDRVTVDGRYILAEVGAPQVSGSPDYRFILRLGALRRLLAEYQPDLIESLCPWVLPWCAIHHRRAFPATALVAGYRTDFPEAHVHRVASNLFGAMGGRVFRWLSYGYAELTYREFDRVYTLGEGARAALARRGVTRSDVLPLGVDTDLFSPLRRDPGYRASLGLSGDGPLLVYAGRIDNEKRADRLVAMMRALPPSLGAALVMVGEGKLRDRLVADSAGLPIAFPGFLDDRAALARALASSDIYVSAMADETFGISVIEAQACGLPVVGVAAGAMPDRVPADVGVLGPVDDVAALADNVVRVWSGERATMARAARALAVDRYGWSRTFERLFGTIYPPALNRAAIRASGERVKAGGREIEATDPPC